MESMDPNVIRYGQDSIARKFSSGRDLTSTFAQLISGQITVTNLPAIECVNKDGYLYAISGNRRLYLYKKLREIGVVNTIRYSTSSLTPSCSEYQKKFTTNCNGMDISVRQGALEADLNTIVAQWKRGENVVAKWPSTHSMYDCDDSDDSDSD